MIWVHQQATEFVPKAHSSRFWVVCLESAYYKDIPNPLHFAFTLPCRLSSFFISSLQQT